MSMGIVVGADSALSARYSGTAYPSGLIVGPTIHQSISHSTIALNIYPSVVLSVYLPAVGQTRRATDGGTSTRQPLGKRQDTAGPAGDAGGYRFLCDSRRAQPG
eukprot:3524870-Pyramimonas_sp.AAC.1